MGFFISNTLITQEVSLIAMTTIAIGLYLLIVSVLAKRNSGAEKTYLKRIDNDLSSGRQWDDRQALFWRHSLGAIAQQTDVWFISAFSASLKVSKRIIPANSKSDAPLCVSRSAQDTEKLLHPLLKKIESRLRKAELRPRPRLIIVRDVLPFPLFSSLRPDTEMSTFILNFLDACIDLSASCDTQVNFFLLTNSHGIKLSAEWRKNQLITDATAQIELLDDMRLTMSGDLVRWDYLVFNSSPQLDSFDERRSTERSSA